MQLIKDKQLVDDTFVRVAAGQPIPESGDVIVSLADFREKKKSLVERDGRLGVLLESDEGPEELADDLASISVVAINFPKFADGRGFSTARLLRDRYKFEGELRAVGYVLRDQLFYLFRCGIDAFQLPEGTDLDEALNAFSEFSVTYQAAADEGLPLYRRRHA